MERTDHLAQPNGDQNARDTVASRNNILFFVIVITIVFWFCWLGDRKGIRPVKVFATKVPKSVLVGTTITWSNCGKMGPLNKNPILCLCYRNRYNHLVPASFIIGDLEWPLKSIPAVIFYASTTVRWCQRLVFWCRPSDRPCMFPQYLWYALMDFHQTFGSNASWDKDELIRFWGQKVKVTSKSQHDQLC